MEEHDVGDIVDEAAAQTPQSEQGAQFTLLNVGVPQQIEPRVRSKSLTAHELLHLANTNPAAVVVDKYRSTAEDLARGLATTQQAMAIDVTGHLLNSFTLPSMNFLNEDSFARARMALEWGATSLRAVELVNRFESERSSTLDAIRRYDAMNPGIAQVEQAASAYLANLRPDSILGALNNHVPVLSLELADTILSTLQQTELLELPDRVNELLHGSRLCESLANLDYVQRLESALPANLGSNWRLCVPSQILATGRGGLYYPSYLEPMEDEWDIEPPSNGTCVFVLRVLRGGINQVANLLERYFSSGRSNDNCFIVRHPLEGYWIVYQADDHSYYAREKARFEEVAVGYICGVDLPIAEVEFYVYEQSNRARMSAFAEHLKQHMARTGFKLAAPEPREIGMWTDTEEKLKELRAVRDESRRHRKITINRTNACQKVGIDPKTARKHEPELYKHWEDWEY